MAEPELSQLLDAAIGTPEVGSVNFTALRSLLQAMLGRLSLLEGDRAAQAAAGLEQDGDRAQAVGQQLPEPREQLPGKDSVSGTASGPQLASVATDVGQMKEKVKENESGISKALEEIGGMKAAQTRMGEDIQAMQEALGLLQDKLQEAAGRLPGPRKQRWMDTDEESSGGHSPHTKPTLSHVDVQRRASSALGPEGAGGQAVPRSSEGTPGTQPGSLGMRAGSRESAATTKKGTDAPADERRRRSDASTTAPGTQPGAAGIKTQSPGAQPGSAGVSPLRDPSMSRGSWGPSSIPLDESSVTLRGRVSSLQGQASDMQDETGKVRQLEDAFGKLGVSGDDLDVDGSERSTLQPGSTLQEIKKELPEVMELRLEQMKQELKDLGLEQMKQELKDLGLEQMKQELKDLGLEQMKRELKDLGLEQMKRELKDLGLEQMKQELKVLGLEQMKQELKDLGLEQMKRELKELAEHQEISKATLKKLGVEMDKQLQAQQEKLRALESVGQEAAACPACSGDTRAQVGQLLQRYEKLQEAVDALLSRLAAYKVARHLPRRSQQDEELLKRLQATMVQVQGDHEKLSSIVGNMRDESHQKQKDTKALFQSLERLVKQKADKEDLELGIDVKADKSALAGKVNHAEFDARMERLKEMFQEMLSRVTGQEQLQQQLSEELAAKLDRLELGPFRQQLEGHWESILKQLQEKAAQAEDDDAAGIRKLLLAHFHCLSCDRPLDVRVPGPCIVTIPSSPPMPPRPTGQPPTVLKSEQEQQDGKREPPAEPRYPTVPRSCGGRHTVTTPLQRRQCLRPPPHLQHLLLPSKCNVVDLLAKDRRISRGRLEEPLPALRGTEEPSPGQPWPAPHQLGKPRPASHEPEEPKPTEPKPAQHKADWANGPLSLAPRPPRSRPSARPARPQHVFFKT